MLNSQAKLKADKKLECYKNDSKFENFLDIELNYIFWFIKVIYNATFYKAYF